jgi:hypothetical protein
MVVAMQSIPGHPARHEEGDGSGAGTPRIEGGEATALTAAPQPAGRAAAEGAVHRGLACLVYDRLVSDLAVPDYAERR